VESTFKTLVVNSNSRLSKVRNFSCTPNKWDPNNH